MMRSVLRHACVWQWVGGWRVDMNSGAADVDGWCYGATAQDLLAGRGGEQGLVAKGKRRVRCRYKSRFLLRIWGAIHFFKWIQTIRLLLLQPSLHVRSWASLDMRMVAGGGCGYGCWCVWTGYARWRSASSPCMPRWLPWSCSPAS